MRWLGRSVIVAAVAAIGVTGTLFAQAAVQERKEREKTSPGKDKVQVFERMRMFGGGSRIGVTLREVDQDAARRGNLKAAEGALVEDVQEGSPAAKAGVRDGDVITAFDGERVRSVRQLQRLVSETPPGRAVKVSVLRDGKPTDVSVTPEEREGPIAFAYGPGRNAEIRRGVEEGLRNVPREFRFEAPAWSFEHRLPEGWAEGELGGRLGEPGGRIFQWFGGEGRLGASVQDLTAQLAEYFGAKDGVLVTSVSADSPASRGGLHAGDVIVTVNGNGVSSPSELVRALREVDDGAEVRLGIVRDRKSQTLTVKLEGRRRGVVAHS